MTETEQLRKIMTGSFKEMEGSRENEITKESPILVLPEKPVAIIETTTEFEVHKIEQIKDNAEEEKNIQVGKERKERKVFVTGATGFVGSNVIYELINKGYEVFALARSKKGETPEARIAQALRIINPQFDTSLQDAGIKVFSGDLLQEDLGLNVQQVEELKEIESAFNMAADVSFAEEERKLIMAVNYDGTRNLIDLLYKIGKPHLHHASTAYVFGDLAEWSREAIFKESDLDVKQNFRNPYEESKFRAEQLIKSDPYLVSSIYRLGIIMGDSETYQTNSFNAFYGFWRVFYILKRLLEKEMRQAEKRQKYEEFDIYFEGDVLHLPIQIPGDPDATANLVPIDWVVKSIMSLSEHALVKKKNFTFHITHNNPPVYSEIVKTALKTLGIEKVEVNPRAAMQFLTKYSYEESQKSEDPRIRIMGQILKGISDYIPYVYGEPKIDTTVRDSVKDMHGKPIIPPTPQMTPAFMEAALRYAIDRNFKAKP